MPQRDERGHWLPGTSGNPGGRRKGVREQAYQAAKDLEIEDIDLFVLKYWIQVMLLNDRDAMDASKCLADRLWGKPTQAVSLGDEGDDLALSLRRLVERAGGNGNA